MEFRLLGSIEAEHDGHMLVLHGVKQRALLAVLLLHANEFASCDSLIDQLWGERPPVTARHTLEAYVCRLRKLLEATSGCRTRRSSG